MTLALAWVLLGSSVLVALVRRRSIAVVLVAAQSFGLGIYALTGGAGASSALLVSAAILIAKAVLLPALMLSSVRRARKERPLTSEYPAFVRLAIAVGAALAVEQLIPPFGLTDSAVEHTAVAMLALGIAVAVVRRAVIFQALGFLIAENGVYFAGLSLSGGLPVFIELGIAFDVVLTVSVAAAFATKIHEQLGSGDSSVLRTLRD